MPRFQGPARRLLSILFRCQWVKQTPWIHRTLMVLYRTSKYKKSCVYLMRYNVQCRWRWNWIIMMTSSIENIFRVTGPLGGVSTGYRWTPPPPIKASEAELWCFLWSAPEQTVKQIIETPMIWDAIALIMTSLLYSARTWPITSLLIVTSHQQLWYWLRRIHLGYLLWGRISPHYNDVIMGAMASQITSLTIVYLAVYSGTDQRKHQISASLAGDRRIPRTKGQ